MLWFRREIKNKKIGLAKRKKTKKSEAKENKKPKVVIISDDDSELFFTDSIPKLNKKQENHKCIEIIQSNSRNFESSELLPESKSRTSVTIRNPLTSTIPERTSSSLGCASVDDFKPCRIRLTRLNYDSVNTTREILSRLEEKNSTKHNVLNSSKNEFHDAIKPCSVDLSRDKISLLITSSSCTVSGRKMQSILKLKNATPNASRLSACTHKRTALRKKHSSLRRSLSFLSSPEREPSCSFVSDAKFKFGDSASLFDSKSRASFAALHSSKKGCVTNNRKRRKCDFKITDGISTFSFSEHAKEAQESMHIFQHSVITGHHESGLSNAFLHSFHNQQNLSASKSCVIQSTPFVKDRRTLFAAKLTPFQISKVTLDTSTNGYPVSSTPSLRSLSSHIGKSGIGMNFSRSEEIDLGCSFEVSYL